MEERHFENAHDLKEYFEQFGDDHLFRGQVQHYSREDGTPDLSSSIARQECIPPLMRRWSYYANEALSILDPGHLVREKSQHFLQALLQHYGWRSFYLDFSADFRVGAWFGSHKYHEMQRGDLVEDFDECPILLRHKKSTFNQHEGVGHIYVASKAAVVAEGKEVIDLSVLPAHVAARPTRQRGWLVGPIPFRFGDKTLNSATLVAHVSAPTGLLRELADEAGLDSTEMMFPSPDEDAFLAYLERLPWRNVGPDRDGLPAFERSLDIPNYHCKFVKRYPPSTTFYTPFSIADERASFTPQDGSAPSEWTIKNALFISVPELALFHLEIPQHTDLPNLRGLLEQHGTVIIETDEIVSHLPDIDDSTYTKGVVVEPKGEEVTVSELIVEHPGRHVGGVGSNVGYVYRWSGDRLERTPSQAECPCNNSWRHERHIAILAGLDPELPRAQRVDDLTLKLPF